MSTANPGDMTTASTTPPTTPSTTPPTTPPTTPSRAPATSRILIVSWIILLGSTGGSFWISDVDRGSTASTALGVLGLATLKAHLVAGVFMEMVHAPRVWAFVMSGFLLMLGASLIALLS